MWLVFSLTTLLCAAFCMVPGYLLLRVLGFPREWAFVSSPIIGIAEISVLGELYALAHVTSSPVSILAPLTVIPLVLLFALRRRRHELRLPHLDPWLIVLYLLVGVLVSYSLFVSYLPLYRSIYQAPDITFHLNEIRAFADSGRFTLLNVDSYLGDDAAINPIPGSGFYPTAWHSLCALVVQATGRETAFAINASMWFFSGAVWPMGVLALLAYAFPRRRNIQIAGSLVCEAFVLFPWTLLIFGPEYPNLAGFAALPITLVLFMQLFGNSHGWRERTLTALAFLAAAMGQALLHPNTLFTAVVLLTPYCVDRIWRIAHEQKGLSSRRSIALMAAFCLFVLAVWVALFRAPFMQSTVNYPWPSYTEPFQQFFNILTLSYDFLFSYEYAPEYVLGALVIIGFVWCLYHGRHRWLAFSYLLPCLILEANATSNSDLLRRFLGGFWYSDPIRISAMCVIGAAPLAAIGFAWVYRQAIRLVRRYNGRRRSTHPQVVAGVLAALFLILTFMPNLYVPGNYVVYDNATNFGTTSQNEATMDAIASLRGEPNVRSTFGNYNEHISKVYAIDAPLSEDELEFLQQVQDYVSPSDVIINNPMDGSFLAYGSNDLRIYYRVIYGYGDRETSESWAIRERLCNLTSDQEVRDAVDKIGATYVLVLSEENSADSMINDKQLYQPLGFAGISSIRDDTPGFEVALSSGDLRLYRIVG